jgi:2'-5' RNA ligase
MDLLADYSDSSGSEDAPGPSLQNGSRKRRARPADLPDAASSLGVAPPRVLDAQGKRRRFEHEDNRLPCSVYLEAPVDPAHVAAYGRYVRAAARACRAEELELIPLYPAAAGGRPHDPAPHVSLSRVFTLRRSQVDEAIEALRGALRDRRGFDAALEGGRLFVNEDRSRSFVGLLLTEGTGEALDLIAAVDGVLRGLDKPVFYDPPVPHASVAWAPGDISERLLPQQKPAGTVDAGSLAVKADVAIPHTGDSGQAADGDLLDAAVDTEARAATPAVPVELSSADVLRLETRNSGAAAKLNNGRPHDTASETLRVAWHVRCVCIKIASSVSRIMLRLSPSGSFS